MDTIKVSDKRFRVMISEADIKKRVADVAARLSRDLADKNPLLLAVLNGSFVFAADLMRAMTTPAEVSFVKLSSYEATASTGTVSQLIGLNTSIEGRHVVIVEDIVDSGLTMKRMTETLAEKKPASVSICTLFFKPGNLRQDVKIDYAAFEIPNDFIVGYGLDYNQQGRGLRDVYILAE